jgi:preprotein translocase subunit SecD
VIREPIMGGTGQISGGLTPEEAKTLADRISSGASTVEVETAPD